MTRFLALAPLALVLAGCCSNDCIVPEAEWTRSSPEQTFELFQRAANCDDDVAAYACLSSDTRRRIPEIDFADMWSVAGDRIRALGKTEIVSLAEKPGASRPTRKATFGYQGIEVSFDMVEEDGMWFFRYPSAYHSEDELRELMEQIDDQAGGCE